MAIKRDPKVARMSGRCAALSGKGRFTCPYVAAGPLRAAWLSGYDQAIDENKRPEDQGGNRRV